MGGCGNTLTEAGDGGWDGGLRGTGNGDNISNVNKQITQLKKKITVATVLVFFMWIRMGVKLRSSWFWNKDFTD